MATTTVPVDDITAVVDFGSESYQKYTISYVGRSLLLLLPGALLGHTIDTLTEKIANKVDIVRPSQKVVIQTLLNILFVFLLQHYIAPKYVQEFQSTIPGMFYVALFFGLQTNYINNIKTVLTRYIH